MRGWRRARYAVVLAIGLAWTADVLARQGVAFTDWLAFEIAARTFIHFQHKIVYAGNPFGLYARDPTLQIGPPAWLPVAGFQWLSPWPVNVGFGIVMTLLGFGAVACVESISRLVRDEMSERRRAWTMLFVGAAVMIVWGYNDGRWHHLDDAMAITFTVFACVLVQRRRAWWLVGILLGTAVAAKPWAIIFAPVLFGIPREARSKAALGMILVAAAWWGPFVLGAPGTIHALGTYAVPVRPGSTLWLFGLRGDVHHWLRPVQFIGGIGIGTYVATRGRSAWLAAPLAALAFRVLTDPFMWSYYGLGPVMFALLWDMSRPARWTKLPVYSIGTLIVEGLLPWLPVAAPFGTSWQWMMTVEWSKVVWGLAVLAAIVTEARAVRTRTADDGDLARPPRARMSTWPGIHPRPERG